MGSGTKGKWNKFGEKLRDRYMNSPDGKNASANYLQAELLKFINEYDLGISLYQMEQTGKGTSYVAENWKKLELDGKGSVKKLPCEKK